MINLPLRQTPASRPRKRLSLLLWATGVGCLLVWGFVYLEAAWWDLAARWRLEQTTTATDPPADPRSEAANVPPQASPWGVLDEGDLVGRIAIPRLDVDAAIYHGVDDDTLRRAVGHVPGTALPGEGDNVGLAGHRDTFFRGLSDTREGDLVIVETPHGERRYRVAETRVVDPDAVEVLDPTGAETLTLVTCYPFRWVGPAPRRWIVRATAVDSDA